MKRSLVMQGAAVAALAAALLLAGCGRKGPLDPPPTASAAPQEVPPGEQPTLGGVQPSLDGDTNPTAARGQKRRIPIDVLID